MITVTESIVLNRPSAEVFAMVAEPRHQLVWDSETLKEVELLTPGALGLQARYRGRFEGLGVVEYEYVEYMPVERFAHRTGFRWGKSITLLYLNLSQTGRGSSRPRASRRTGCGV